MLPVITLRFPTLSLAGPQAGLAVAFVRSRQEDRAVRYRRREIGRLADCWRCLGQRA